MITVFKIYNKLKEVDEMLGKILPVDTSYERLNEIKALEISKLIYEDEDKCKNNDYINTDYIGEMFPRLTRIQCREFLEFCKNQTISRKECFGDGKTMLLRWMKQNED